jgi:VanZ family protein
MIKKNIFSILLTLVIIFLSFARAETFSGVNVLGISHLDKIVHACMYFTLMAVLLYENRSALNKSINFILLAIIPFGLGSLIELLQSWLTDTREGDIRDVIFNLLGIVLAGLAWWIIQRHRKSEN